ncbi:MAG: 16S rRNA (guanine(966)-N(2))-methyltransferase RsmD [Epsilonproteobacteria bacterium]|nr:MAG: 16S rRNA (guanine(966)-N(2))-methyltransferase RsmD [Campylobacterota bacterium]
MTRGNINKPTTKIVGGKYKGKVLALPSLDITRSSKSILKESFFNVLQFDIIDTIFIEVFGGSGSIGLEALSRGSSSVCFCEIDRKSYRILQENCKVVEPEKCTTLFGDSFEKFPPLLQSLVNKKEDIIVYIDPPFDFRDGMEDIYDKTYNLVRDIENDNVVLVTFEHMTGLDLPDTLGKFKKFKTKKFGKSSLTYYNV